MMILSVFFQLSMKAADQSEVKIPKKKLIELSNPSIPF